MKTIRNKIIPFPGYKAVNLFGVLFVRPHAVIDNRTLVHESIHSAQMRELLYVPFYLIYALEWLARWFADGFLGHEAYREIMFEREAYTYENDPEYLLHRRRYAMWRKPHLKAVYGHRYKNNQLS